MLHRLRVFAAGSLAFLLFILMYCHLGEESYVWAAVNFVALVFTFIEFVVRGDE